MPLSLRQRQRWLQALHSSKLLLLRYQKTLRLEEHFSHQVVLHIKFEFCVAHKKSNSWVNDIIVMFLCTEAVWQMPMFSAKIITVLLKWLFKSKNWIQVAVKLIDLIAIWMANGYRKSTIIEDDVLQPTGIYIFILVWQQAISDPRNQHNNQTIEKQSSHCKVRQSIHRTIIPGLHF